MKKILLTSHILLGSLSVIENAESLLVRTRIGTTGSTSASTGRATVLVLDLPISTIYHILFVGHAIKSHNGRKSTRNEPFQ